MELHWEDVAGHETQKLQLRTMLREHRLPHALLLSGPAGVGKKKLGHVLAAAHIQKRCLLPPWLRLERKRRKNSPKAQKART